jgi:hypothetical protein
LVPNQVFSSEGASGKVGAVQISRLRADLARVKMKRDIPEKGKPGQRMLKWSIRPANAYFAKAQS